MSEEYVFYPERRSGIIVHAVGLVILSTIALIALWRSFTDEIGLRFALDLLLGLIAVAGLAHLAYRLFSLRNSSYIVEREGVRLRWGLRGEDIPIAQVLAAGHPQDYGHPLPLPLPRWPGAVVGTRRSSRGETFEFMASDTSRLVLLATPGRIYVLSPANPEEFLLAFQRCIEMGSLIPWERRSYYPANLLRTAWRSPAARFSLLAAAALGLGLLVWVILLLPTRSQVLLGARPGVEGTPTPTARLLLLPTLNTLIFTFNLLLGLYFFRRAESQFYAMLLWINSALTSAVFLVALYFIVQAGT